MGNNNIYSERSQFDSESASEMQTPDLKKDNIYLNGNSIAEAIVNGKGSEHQSIAMRMKLNREKKLQQDDDRNLYRANPFPGLQ